MSYELQSAMLVCRLMFNGLDYSQILSTFTPHRIVMAPHLLSSLLVHSCRFFGLCAAHSHRLVVKFTMLMSNIFHSSPHKLKLTNLLCFFDSRCCPLISVCKVLKVLLVVQEQHIALRDYDHSYQFFKHHFLTLKK